MGRMKPRTLRVTWDDGNAVSGISPALCGLGQLLTLSRALSSLVHNQDQGPVHLEEPVQVLHREHDHQ